MSSRSATTLREAQFTPLGRRSRVPDLLGRQCLQPLEPIPEVRALSQHRFKADAARCIDPVKYLPVGAVGLKHAFRRRRIRIVIDVLRRWKSVTDSLKSFCQM